MLSVTQSTSGEWNLSASDDLKTEMLDAALRGVVDMPGFIVPGDPDEIEAAVLRLKAATMRPMWMDAEDATHYEEAVLQACEDYPIDVVQQACANWRKVPEHGKWWPTEQDLRAQCEKVFQPRKSLLNKAHRLLVQLRGRDDEARRANETSPFASGRQMKFREAMRRRMNAARFDAYFHPSDIVFQGESLILVRREVAESVLRREGRDLLQELGLRVVYCPVTFKNIRPRPEDYGTEEEQAEIARKLNLLFAALRGGADIAAMRAEGKL